MCTLKTFVLGELGTNCYVLSSKGEAVVIDPGEESPSVKDYCSENSLKIKYVLLTHGHFDHMGGAAALLSQGCPLICHAEEKEALLNPAINLSGSFGTPKITLSPDITVSEGDIVSFGNLSLKILHTSGHTKGSMSLYSPGMLFSGDALFDGSIGRTDFPGGSYPDLVNSIKQKLYTLPEDTAVYPGHGTFTTIYAQKRENMYVR